MDIIVLLDGTWNDRNDNTNVRQIYDRLKADGRCGKQYLCHYVPGVGTKPLERLRGGIFGLGLDDNIRNGYRFIAEHHRSEEDRIFLIGYSRGAFTARSLAGMIAKCGIVGPKHFSDKELFERYRDENVPGLHDMQQKWKPARSEADKLLLAASRLARIRFIGVFDTVGSLGIPGTVGRWLSRNRYKFHDTKLSGLVDYAYHAIAIDERRKQFEPTLWTGVPKPIPGHTTVLDQRWFIGAHGNVGGGGTKNPDANNPLAAITREWILDRAANAGLAVRSTAPSAIAWQGGFGDSYKDGFWGFLGKLPGNKPFVRPVRDSVEENLDKSVLRRWGWGNPGYRPANKNLETWVKEINGTP